MSSCDYLRDYRYSFLTGVTLEIFRGAQKSKPRSRPRSFTLPLLFADVLLCEHITNRHGDYHLSEGNDHLLTPKFTLLFNK